MGPIDRKIIGAVEAAGISGLCLGGRLEIGPQEARRLRPELDVEALRHLVEAAIAAAGEH